jgi:hypothetical protein
MGVVVDLGAVKKFRQVTVQLSTPGATLALRAGNAASPSSIAGFSEVSKAQSNAPTTVTFALKQPAEAQYVVVWITVLPPHPDKPGEYGLGVQEIKVAG